MGGGHILGVLVEGREVCKFSGAFRNQDLTSMITRSFRRGVQANSVEPFVIRTSPP